MSLLRPKISTVTIANGASLSSGALVGDAVLCGIQYPAAWTAAALTFQISLDGETWKDLYDDAGAEVTINPSSPAGKYVAISPDAFAAAPYVRVRSGTAALAVNQAAARTIYLTSRKFFPLR